MALPLLTKIEIDMNDRPLLARPLVLRLKSWAGQVCLVALLSLTTLACGDGRTSTDAAIPVPPAADAANVDEESIYEVDDEDPYKIFNGTFLDMAPGQALEVHSKRLNKGVLKTADGELEAYFIEGPRGEELGYVMPDPNDPSLLGDLHITSPGVVTERGVRVGNSYGELVERLGKLEVHGSELESRTYATDGKLHYRLDEPHNTYEVAADEVSPNAKVLAIVVRR